VLDLSALQAGLWTVPWALAFVFGSMLTPPLAARFPAGAVVTAGLVLAALGFAVLAQPFIALNLALIVVGSVTMSLGLAAVFTLATDLVVSAAPPERAGAASALSETSSEFGGALGIAVLGSIGTATYRSGMTAETTTGVPQPALDAARDSLGAALAVAGELPDHVADGLVSVARGSFEQGLQLVSLISTFTMVLTALFFLAAVRPGRSIPSPASGT